MTADFDGDIGEDGYGGDVLELLDFERERAIDALLAHGRDSDDEWLRTLYRKTMRRGIDWLREHDVLLKSILRHFGWVDAERLPEFIPGDGLPPELDEDDDGELVVRSSLPRRVR